MYIFLSKKYFKSRNNIFEKNEFKFWNSIEEEYNYNNQKNTSIVFHSKIKHNKNNSKN